MKTINLKFPSVIYLIAFRKFSKAKDWDINLNDLLVRCTCSERDIQVACRDFKANVVTEHEHVESTVLLRELAMSQVSAEKLRSA